MRFRTGRGFAGAIALALAACSSDGSSGNTEMMVTAANAGAGSDDPATGGMPEDPMTEPQTGGAAPQPMPAPDCVPAPNAACELDPLPSTGDLYEDCVVRINQFRTGCLCLEPLERWTEGEACADMHAEYDSTRSAHAGFRDDICEGGWAQNECPGWRSENSIIEGCLQSMWDEGPPPTDPCNDQCYQDHGHFIAMSSTEYSGVACGFYTTPDGEVWSVQNFTR